MEGKIKMEIKTEEAKEKGKTREGSDKKERRKGKGKVAGHYEEGRG